MTDVTAKKTFLSAVQYFCPFGEIWGLFLRILVVRGSAKDISYKGQSVAQISLQLLLVKFPEGTYKIAKCVFFWNQDKDNFEIFFYPSLYVGH